jgi:hypothetical protein
LHPRNNPVGCLKEGFFKLLIRKETASAAHSVLVNIPLALPEGIRRSAHWTMYLGKPRAFPTELTGEWILAVRAVGGCRPAVRFLAGFCTCTKTRSLSFGV